MGNKKICELCSNEAAVYCQSDSAFLCMSCDTKVHGANFLVARHLRQVICSDCQDFTGDHISGGGVIYKSSNCPFCSTSELDSGELDSLSSSSSCVLSSFSTRKKSIPAVEVNGGQRVKWGIDSKTEGVFVNLCKRFGLNDEVATVIVRMACNGLAGCEGKLSSLPFRVRLVASLWFGLRFSGIRSLSTSQGLTRLEQITGVPAKLISVAELKIERIYRPVKQGKNNLVSRNYNQHGLLLKEGWAESS